MEYKYNLSGMTCAGCQYKVEHLLSQIGGVSNVAVSLEENTVTMTTDRAVSKEQITDALGGPGSRYSLADDVNNSPMPHGVQSDVENHSWPETYKPILLIFSYITAAVLLVQFSRETFDPMQAMRHFMAGFFLVFSFFKMLDLKAFAGSYAMYDVVARKLPGYGYLYAFLELGLGIAFLINYNPMVTNVVTIVIMGVSIIGVLQTVLNKKKIQCACLGGVFNLPMSTVTVIEDGLMILMSAVMLWMGL